MSLVSSKGNFDFICVSGYGKSGSGACIDLLSEFEHIGGIDKEFRMAKDPYGLLDLELSIVDNWEFVRHNAAINDFLKYCSMLGRGGGVFQKTGKNFDKLLDVDLMKESIKYIDKMTDFKYVGDTLLNRYYLNVFRSIQQRLKSKLGMSNAVPMYFSRPTSEKFINETRLYLRNIFKNYAANNGLKKIIIDQSIPPINIKKTLRYFDNAKLIIVDRDPRDIYATMINEGRLLGADILNNQSAEKYIRWHHALRRKTNHDVNNHLLKNKVLRLNYEDFFLNYEDTVDKLKFFLEVDYNHKYKNTRFKMDSKNNYVGIWKLIPEQDIMLQIKKELGEYCYSGFKN